MTTVSATVTVDRHSNPLRPTASVTVHRPPELPYIVQVLDVPGGWRVVDDSASAAHATFSSAFQEAMRWAAIACLDPEEEPRHAL